MRTLTRALAACLGALALAGATFSAQAEYPERPIRLIVGFPPGGGGDLYARMISVPLGEKLGRTVVVENRPGAGGNIAADQVSKADPDGYTLLFAMSGNLALAPVLRGDTLPYKTPDDFAMIGSAIEAPHGLFVPANSKMQSLDDFIKAAQSGNMSFASTGAGGAAHIGMEIFVRLAKLNVLHVPYRGSGPAITDLIGGQVNTFFATAPPVYGQVTSGALRLLAITGDARSDGMPGVPTFKELGYNVPVTQWYGLAAPKGTPPEILQKLSKALSATLAEPAVKKTIQQDGARVVDRPLDEFRKFIVSDIEQYREGVTPELKALIGN